jgi:predicted small metal-binding protein
MAYELNCKACGQHFSNADKEQLARDVEEHNRKMHGQERLDRQAFEERVRQTA